MTDIIFLIAIEILTILVIKEHYFNISKLKFYTLLFVNLLLSIFLWYLVLNIKFHRGNFDDPQNVINHMNFNGMLAAVVMPRFLLSLLHYTGRLIKLRKRNHLRWLTTTGIVIYVLVFIIIAGGTFIGRYNFKTDNVEIKIEGLKPELNGLKIVQLSDLHLASFYKHADKLQQVIEKANSYKPDLIINTGDFVSYGWREYGRLDTILAKGKSRFGNYAILGNHDMGTYLPDATQAEKVDNILRLNQLVTESGYHLLNDENVVTEINGVRIEFIGVRTSGRFPNIIHSDVRKAMGNRDSVDFKILLAHDPNQWDKDVCGKTDITLTLSGHTHGMQMGILTKRFRWSPSKRFYPHWNGLYSKNGQYLYVNRGLGVLAIPFRIWMPPEITVITLVSV